MAAFPHDWADVGHENNASVKLDQTIEEMWKMETTCNWATIGILLVVFIGLISFAGCIHVAELFGSAVIGIMVARTFYFSICKNNPGHLARQK
jgi:hypothetical protein